MLEQPFLPAAVRDAAHPLLAVGTQRKQIKIVIRSAVQDTSVKINSGINERVGGAAIFRLHVIGRAPCLHVRIVTEKHFAARPDLQKLKALRSILPSRFDRVALESLL